MSRGSRLAGRLYQWGSRWSGGAFGEAKHEIFHGVDHGARYRNYPRFREPLRIAMLLLFLVVFTVWIALDLASNDGFAPGIRDGATVSTELVTDLNSVDAKPGGGICFCPCSFDKNPTLAPQTFWNMDDAVKPLAVGSWTCDKALLPPPGSVGRDYVMWLADWMFLRLLPSPNSEFLLDFQGWAAARYEEAWEASRVQLAILQQDLRIRDDLTNEQKLAINDVLKYARAGIFATHAAHLGVEAFNSVLVTYGQQAIGAELKRFNCSVTQLQRDHFRLVEWCQPDPLGDPVECSRVYPQAPSPLAAAYQAYKQHCNPVICNCIQQKTAYQTFIAAAAVLGGVYSICTIVMYLVWLALRLAMDGEGYESFRRNTMAQQQQQQQHLSLQLSEFPPDQPEQHKCAPTAAGAPCCVRARHDTLQHSDDSCFIAQHSSQCNPAPAGATGSRGLMRL